MFNFPNMLTLLVYEGPRLRFLGNNYPFIRPNFDRQIACFTSTFFVGVGKSLERDYLSMLLASCLFHFSSNSLPCLDYTERKRTPISSSLFPFRGISFGSRTGHGKNWLLPTFLNVKFTFRTTKRDENRSDRIEKSNLALAKTLRIGSFCFLYR